MIDLLGALGLVAFLTASLVVGVQLLLLAARTREIPELTIGAGFVVGAVVGYVPETFALSTDYLAPGTERAILSITQIAIRLAAFSILFFTWWVFRRREIWARGLFLVLLGALLVSYIGFPLTITLAATPAERAWYQVFTVSRTLCLVWGSVESLRYYAASRKRLRLGLSDPMVTNRFLLWGVALAAVSLLMASTLLAEIAGVDPSVAGWVLAESTAGLAGAIPMWLTFYPPTRYQAFVRRRAQLAS